MQTTLLAAVSPVDIAFFVILGLGLIGGVIGGLAKAFKGIFASMAIVLLSLLLVGVLLTPMQQTGLGDALEEKLTSTASGWGDAYNRPVHITRGADGQPITDADGNLTYYLELDDSRVALEAAAGKGLVNQAKGKLAVKLARRFIKDGNGNEGKALNVVAADYLSSIILEVILFVVLCIALGIAFWLLRKIFGGMHKSDSVTIRLIDRALGAVLSTAMALIFVLLVFAIIRAAAGAGSKVDTYMAGAQICGNLYVNNPISPLLTKIFG